MGSTFAPDYANLYVTRWTLIMCRIIVILIQSRLRHSQLQVRDLSSVFIHVTKIPLQVYVSDGWAEAFVCTKICFIYNFSYLKDSISKCSYFLIDIDLHTQYLLKLQTTLGMLISHCKTVKTANHVRNVNKPLQNC